MPRGFDPDILARVRAVLEKNPGVSSAKGGTLAGCDRGVFARYRAEVGEVSHQHSPKVSPKVSPQPSAADVQAMKCAAEEMEDYEEPPEQVWERCEKDSARRIKRAKLQHEFSWTAPGSHLLLVAISDMHIAPGTPVDFRKMREDAERIARTPNCFAILGGDQVDNHIKHRAAILAARSQPDDQYRLFEYYLTLLGGKCLLFTSGNHDDWTAQIGGVDMLGRIAREKRICYAPDEAWIDLTVGGQKYKVAIRHQFRMNSSFNQTHSVKQWLRLGPAEFDVGIVGHHHEAAIEEVIYRDTFRWVCRPGSYQITTAYSRAYGYNHAIPTCPTFLLHGDRRQIDGWNSLEKFANCMQAARVCAA